MAGFTRAHKGRDPSPLVDADLAARIKDMDEEGIDVNFTLPSGWFGTWTLSEDPEVETTMYRAYHRCEDILMCACDYPYGESWFPKSVEIVLAWELPDTAKRKLFWDNAVRFYARYGSV